MAPHRSPSKALPSDANIPTRRSRNSARLASSVGVAHQPEASFHDLSVQASHVTGVDDASADPLHSHLRLEVENLQHRKEVLDGEVRLLEKSKEISRLNETINYLQKKLNTVVEARDDALRCSKCKHVTQQPIVMQECSHGFCEPCLRDWFQQQIQQSVKHFDVDIDLKEAPYDAEKIERLRDSNNLSFAGLSCPRCKAYTWRRPRATPFITQLADTLSDVLGVPDNVVEKVVDANEDIWNILFID